MQDPSPGPVDPGRTAFFFDLDGTLAPLAPTPGQARVPQATRAALAGLARASGGAVAIVSGRTITEVDRLLAPLRLAAAGQHGAEVRDVDGALRRLPVDLARLDAMAESLEKLLALDPGLQLERKGMALAMHYRNAPALGGQVERAMRAALAEAEGFALQEGKMVYEIRPREATKGGAIRTLMGLPAFRGRMPLFAGDDLTDESGFAVVESQDGVSIKIGAGPTLARRRLDSPRALAEWLCALPGVA